MGIFYLVEFFVIIVMFFKLRIEVDDLRKLFIGIGLKSIVFVLLLF